MPKVTLGITGLPEILGRDHGIEKPYWGPSEQWQRKCNRNFFLAKKFKEPRFTLCLISLKSLGYVS